MIRRWVVWSVVTWTLFVILASWSLGFAYGHEDGKRETIEAYMRAIGGRDATE